MRSCASLSRTGFLSAVIVACLCRVAPVEAAQVLKGHVPQAVAASRAVGRVPASTPLNLVIGLPLRNPEQLDALIESLSDPSSPNYRQYLTPEQFTEQFAPTEADYRALIAFAESHGLTVVGTHPNRTLLDVTGAVADVEQAFHLNVTMYSHPVRGRFYAPDREPSLDLDIAVLDIAGLDNFEVPRPMELKKVPVSDARSLVTGSGPAGLFIGNDFRAAYAPSVTLQGTGQAVGLLEFDGYYAADLTANFKQAGLTPPVTQTVLLDGFNGVPGSDNVEVILDIVMAGYMAQNLSKVIVYEGLSPNDILNRMATDNLASQLSSSWGFGINAATEQIFKQFIAQGQSFYQASGDSGSYTGGVMPPSDDPNLTVVGGTSLTTSGAGGPWQSETAWTGSGGGISTVYPIPSYQQGLSMAANKGSLTMRNIPDVSLTADVQMFLICNNGQGVSVGGTSAATPLWAAFTALANQYAASNGKPRVGFANPALYSIGKGTNYATDFHDIVLGNDGGFSALAGYDLATGWGTPAGQHLINDLSGVSSQPSFSLSAAPAAITTKPGTPGTSTVTVTRQSGFTGTVSLAATGLPTGVTASFSPASTTGTSTVTFTAGSTAAAGTSTVTIVGTSGSLNVSTTVSLVVAVPTFTLTATPASVTVSLATPGSSVVAVVPANGFTGSVTLAASGLPTGVTASFGAAGTSGTRTVTFTAGTTAVAGTATVTVTGTSGALASTVALTLTTAIPNFSLAVSNGSVNVPRSGTANTAVLVTGQNGFTGTVSLAASGLPAGVTAAFGAANTAGTRPLTLTATSSAAAASATVTVTGTSGTLTHTATFHLTVVVPAAASTLVNLASVANVTGIVTDGTVFAPVGLDGGLNGTGTAYSSSLLGAQQTMGGTTLYFGAADGPDAVSGGTVPLPAAQFSTIKLLATAVNGNQTAQRFVVTYTDGTTSAFVQNLSDWFTPQNFAGETKVLSMPYRDTSNGVKDNRTFLLYGYSFSLNSAKKVSSITLPANRNVVVLAISLGS